MQVPAKNVTPYDFCLKFQLSIRILLNMHNRGSYLRRFDKFHQAILKFDKMMQFQIKQEALQMQRDHTTCHKYEISHLKRFAIGNDLQGH